MVERKNERIEFLCADCSMKNTLMDLSVDGAAFSYSTEVMKDAQLTVKIQDNEIEATVVYCQPKEEGFRIGLQFKNVAPILRESLKTYIDEFSRGIPLACEIVERKKREETADEMREEAQEEVKEEVKDKTPEEA